MGAIFAGYHCYWIMLYEPRVGRFGMRDSALKAGSDKFHENGQFLNTWGTRQSNDLSVLTGLDCKWTQCISAGARHKPTGHEYIQSPSLGGRSDYR